MPRKIRHFTNMGHSRAMQYMNVLLEEISLQFNVEYYTTTENESVILYAIAIS